MVERTLGKGEVGSSILPCGTTHFLKNFERNTVSGSIEWRSPASILHIDAMYHTGTAKEAQAKCLDAKYGLADFQQSRRRATKSGCNLTEIIYMLTQLANRVVLYPPKPDRR